MRNLWTIGLASFALLAASCSEDRDEKAQMPGELASMAITLQGETAVSRAVAPSDDPTVAAAESALKNVTVFVFNANGTLDKKHEFSTSGLTETVSGLIPGAKRVVVVANVPSGITFPAGINYSWFSDASNVIDLDSQEASKLNGNGLFMSGEESISLSAGENAAKTVKISRVVAKVKLGTITLSPESGHDPAKFALKAVHVMKARASATMGLPGVQYTAGAFYGGMTGDKSVLRSYLKEAITVSDHANRYFYVLPSDNDDANTTLVTLEGTYDGDPVYFPFRINDKVGTGGATSDGTFIRRNSGYVVNVTLKKLGSGTDNPEVPADPASIAVTVEPQPWANDLIQNVEW